ncbi:MAG: tRNA (N6-threonylcarbamoyladenosine(37)-N6)-methyltransferase TrmO [Gammaproteobacteria bacterium]|nr:tRNA (N6-threonylcarbamoyladenosine(37)-N6)-methyltransferase TrmO [Gammaproteobacteria bacterium]MBI5616178.1 tRNA (N6-threonylcarbamoyladenosine(37)-N6)-methyltransferase TrmO [Gammaproteobacteria bacterium]
MLALPDCQLRPIGRVECAVPDAEIPRRRRELVSDIVIADAFADGLAGIEEYSHLFVLFWMDRQPAAPVLLAHPRGDSALPLTGAFAMRGRNHPNPIGLAVVELVARTGTRLTVRRLDAFDGTPVLDIKPYDHYDLVPDPRVPQWFRDRAGLDR